MTFSFRMHSAFIWRRSCGTDQICTSPRFVMTTRSFSWCFSSERDRKLAKATRRSLEPSCAVSLYLLLAFRLGRLKICSRKINNESLISDLYEFNL